MSSDPHMRYNLLMKDRLICSCERVYESTIREAIVNGASSFTELQNTTGLGRSCGNCRPLVERILREYSPVSDEMDDDPCSADDQIL